MEFALAREKNQMCGAIAITRAKTRCDDARARHRERGLRPRTFESFVALVRPHFFDLRVHEQVINVPVQFFVGAPKVARDPLRQTVHRATDVQIFAARKFERAERADANRLGARQVNDERVRAA